MGVDKFAGQILLALDALDIELLTHAIRVKGSFACGALKCLLVEVHDLLANTDWL